MYRTGRVLSLLAVLATSTIAWAGSGSGGNCQPGDVEVRGTLTIPNNTGKTASDLHFYMYQNDRPSVQATGAEAECSDFNNVSVTMGTDNGKDPDPDGNWHGAQVNMDGGTVPPGASAKIPLTLCMNERNCIKFKNIEWTFTGPGGPGGPPVPAAPGNGMRVFRPFLGGNGGDPAAQEGNGGAGFWVHIFCIENDGTEPLLVTELKLLASTTYYNDPTVDIDWSTVPTIQNGAGEPPVTIPPGGVWCYYFETTGSYLNGHIYFNYSVAADAASGSNLEATADDPQANVIGDHPVDKEQDDILDGIDLWQTVDITQITLDDNDLPKIPPDFFGPGSDPFDGVIGLSGMEIDPALYGTADTIISRTDLLELPTVGSTGTIPIEMVALNLVSVDPFVVPTFDPLGSAFQDVFQNLTFSDTPSSPIEVRVSNDAGATDDEQILISLLPAYPTDILWSMIGDDDGIGGAGFYGVDSFFDVFYDLDPSLPEFPVESALTTVIEMTEPGGTGPLPVLGFAQSFDPIGEILTVAWYTDTPAGLRQQHTLTVQANPAQPVSLVYAEANPPQFSVDSFFDITYQLYCDLPPAMDPLAPVLTADLHVETLAYMGDSFFDVYYELDASQPTTGTMDAERTMIDGGLFDMQIEYTPKITFVEWGTPTEATMSLELPGVGPQTYTTSGSMTWTYLPPASPIPAAGPNFWPTPATPITMNSAISASPHTLLAAEAYDPPTIASAVSRKTHGGTGDFDVDILAPSGTADVAVEPRTGGPTRIVVNFSQDVQAPDGLDPSDVSLASSGAADGTVSNVAIVGSELAVDMTGTSDEARLSIGFPGIASLDGIYVGESLCLGVLLGDTDASGAINIFDLLNVRNKLSQPVDATSFRSDLTAEGVINIFDLLAARNNLTHTLTGACP